MAALLPSEFTKFALGDITTTEDQAQVSATSAEQSSAIGQVIWTVHQRADAAAAQAFMASTTKKLYAEDASTATGRRRRGVLRHRRHEVCYCDLCTRPVRLRGARRCGRLKTRRQQGAGGCRSRGVQGRSLAPEWRPRRWVGFV